MRTLIIIITYIALALCKTALSCLDALIYLGQQSCVVGTITYFT